jgi:hypothetical protein
MPPGSAIPSIRAATLTPSPRMSSPSMMISPTLIPIRNRMGSASERLASWRTEGARSYERADESVRSGGGEHVANELDGLTHHIGEARSKTRMFERPNAPRNAARSSGAIPVKPNPSVSIVG